MSAVNKTDNVVTGSEKKKRVALVDIDGCLWITGPDGKHQLNPAVVKFLKEGNFDEIILFTQRRLEIVRQQVVNYFDSDEEVFKGTSVIREEFKNAMVKEMGNEMSLEDIQVSFSGELLEEEKDYIEKLRTFETGYLEVFPIMSSDKSSQLSRMSLVDYEKHKETFFEMVGNAAQENNSYLHKIGDLIIEDIKMGYSNYCQSLLKHVKEPKDEKIKEKLFDAIVKDIKEGTNLELYDLKNSNQPSNLDKAKLFRELANKVKEGKVHQYRKLCKENNWTEDKVEVTFLDDSSSNLNEVHDDAKFNDTLNLPVPKIHLVKDIYVVNSTHLRHIEVVKVKEEQEKKSNNALSSDKTRGLYTIDENFQKSIKNAVNDLTEYKAIREADKRGEYFHIPVLSRLGGGYSKTEKLHTVEKLSELLTYIGAAGLSGVKKVDQKTIPDDIKLNSKDIAVLNQGRLKNYCSPEVMKMVQRFGVNNKQRPEARPENSLSAS